MYSGPGRIFVLNQVIPLIGVRNSTVGLSEARYRDVSELSGLSSCVGSSSCNWHQFPSVFVRKSKALARFAFVSLFLFNLKAWTSSIHVKPRLLQCLTAKIE